MEIMTNEWDGAAEIRKFQIESGIDITFNRVFLPIYVDLLQCIRPCFAIEIGGGTGHMALHLKEYCEHLHVIEPSAGMHDVAKGVLAGSRVTLSKDTCYSLSLSNHFDFGYSHLCAHTVDDLDGFLISARKLLKINSYFIYSFPHPFFYKVRANEKSNSVCYMNTRRINSYLKISLDDKNAINDLPHIHRPVSNYVNSTITSGFKISNLLEVWPSKEVMSMYPVPWEGPRYCMLICIAV